MLRSEITKLFNDFRETYQRLSSLTVDAAAEEADFEREKAAFDSLFARINECRALLDEEQRVYVQRVSSSPFRHRVRVALNRSRTRSLSRSQDTSVSEIQVNTSQESSNSLPSEASFASSSSRTAMDSTEKVIDGDKDVSNKNQVGQEGLLLLQFEAEDARLEFEEDQRTIEKKRRERQRELLLRAAREGVDVDVVTKALPSLESPQPPPTSSPLNPVNGMAPQKPGSKTPNPPAAATTPSTDHLLQLFGSQKLANSKPPESERFSGGPAEYAVFYAKFKSEVLELKGVTDTERFVSLQDRTKGEAKEIVEKFIYLEDK